MIRKNTANDGNLLDSLSQLLFSYFLGETKVLRVNFAQRLKSRSPIDGQKR